MPNHSTYWTNLRVLVMPKIIDMKNPMLQYHYKKKYLQNLDTDVSSLQWHKY
jgi:hypothetical protein